MIDERELPEPYSDQLKAALRRRHAGSAVHEYIYEILYRRRLDPPTNEDITEFVYEKTGSRPSQLQRRRRQLNEVFLIERVDGFRYRLVGWLPEKRAEAVTISQRLRFKVLQSGRCRACGRTVADDNVKLVVDHILPQAWGGDNTEENLQALCEECNAGKKDYYGQFDQFQAEISAAATFDEPHRRIAMLLKAFNGEYVPSELLGAVASAKQYQEDWQKRTRELRVLGIDYETRKRRLDSGRVVVDWRLTKWQPLPDEPLAPLIRRLERLRKVG